MIQNDINKSRSCPLNSYRLFYILFGLSLVPWLVVQLNQSINVDIAILTNFALGFIKGDRFLFEIFDTNPPLSTLVQIPPALLYKLTSIPVYYCTILYSFTIISISTICTSRMLEYSGYFSNHERVVLVLAYIIANTVLCSLYLGERDHLVILALVPMTLFQLELGKQSFNPAWRAWILFLAGSIFILLKPFYIIISFLLITLRALSQKRPGAFLDKDALCLALACLGYGIMMIFIFHDFWQNAVPLILEFYLSQKDSRALTAGAFMLVCLLIYLLVILALPFEKRTKSILIAFTLLSAFCIGGFILQTKGFYYHLIPFIVIMCCNIAYMIYHLLSLKLNGSHSTVITTLICLSLSYALMPPNLSYPTHNDYKNLPLSLAIQRYCPENCRFFMFNDMTEIIHQTAVYTNSEHASRFPVYWFLPGIINNQEKAQKYETAFVEMVTEDFKKIKPDLLIIGHFKIDQSKQNENFKFGDYFSKNPEFEKLWSEYEKASTLRINRKLYFQGTYQGLSDDMVEYDIYLRRDNEQSK
jgi:hypothetical protein